MNEPEELTGGQRMILKALSIGLPVEVEMVAASANNGLFFDNPLKAKDCRGLLERGRIRVLDLRRGVISYGLAEAGNEKTS